MGAQGWAVVGFFVLAWVVWINYMLEEARAARAAELEAQREEAWLRMLLAARTRALGRVVQELERAREEGTMTND